MRFLPKSHCRKCVQIVVAIGLLIGTFWVYVIATRSPINGDSFTKLHGGMPLTEIEDLLGIATQPVRTAHVPPPQPPAIAGAFDPRMHSWWMNLDIPGFSSWDNSSGGLLIESNKIGDLKLGTMQLLSTNRERPSTVTVHTWDGPEARISASFDEQNRMLGASIQWRVSWRTRMREWLPWLP